MTLTLQTSAFSIYEQYIYDTIIELTWNNTELNLVE